MLAGLSPARRRLVVMLSAVLVVGALVLGGLALATRPSHEEPAPAPVPQERPGPVLLIPGYGGGAHLLRDLEAQLTAAGREVVVVPSPGNGTGDLRAGADALGDAVDEALERTGADSVDVVGYSAGGVVARLWVADGGADLVRRVVTLGSPHHGTTLADLVGGLAPDRCPLACLQLTTDSDLLRGLNAGDETPEGPTWVSIWTEQDGLVTPPESARLDGALNLPVQSICADAQVGHEELPRNPLVQQMVIAQLEPGEPVPLTAADCTRLGG